MSDARDAALDEQAQIPLGYRIYAASKYVFVPLFLIGGALLIGKGSPGLGIALLVVVMVDMALISPLLMARLSKRRRVSRGTGKT